MKDSQRLLDQVRQLQAELSGLNPVPEEGHRAASNEIVAVSLVRSTRGYIEKIANQANRCYERGWFDGCAVMVRRLIETLLIEAFEKHRLEASIRDPRSGDFLFLKDLITAALVELTWNLSRNTKAALPRLKDVGDRSAHSRRFVANRQDIDALKADIRLVVQEFIYLAGLK